MPDEQTSPGATESDSNTQVEATEMGATVDTVPAEVTDGQPQDPTDAGTDTDEASDTGQEPVKQAEKVNDLPPWAQKLIKDARKGEGDYRKRAQEEAASRASTEEKLQGFLDGFSKVLGLSADTDATNEAPTPPDPEKLTSELEAAQREHHATRVELAVFRSAGEYDGDPDALLDSRSFLNKVLDLDPSAGDFNDKVATAIKEAVASNPKLKAQSPVSIPAAPTPPSGGDFASGPREKTDAESMSVDDFRKRRSNRRG